MSAKIIRVCRRQILLSYDDLIIPAEYTVPQGIFIYTVYLSSIFFFADSLVIPTKNRRNS